MATFDFTRIPHSSEYPKTQIIEYVAGILVDVRNIHAIRHKLVSYSFHLFTNHQSVDSGVLGGDAP